ncbi:hypothetical protein U9M48_002649 [Paspalum notatum var. saurae]|uniref:Uncharacterized protein n=1 Tax=Paspalum notatum var. saurae TaxID=547442 RepID=A0AAQ3PG98_PASNO
MDGSIPFDSIVVVNILRQFTRRTGSATARLGARAASEVATPTRCAPPHTSRRSRPGEAASGSRPSFARPAAPPTWLPAAPGRTSSAPPRSTFARRPTVPHRSALPHADDMPLTAVRVHRFSRWILLRVSRVLARTFSPPWPLQHSSQSQS